MSFELRESDENIIRELQKGLPLCSRPFKVIAEKLGIGEKELLERINDFKEEGIIRRFGARVKHHEAGYKENIMVVWSVREERLEETGSLIASYPQVSHCYARPELPDFPYNLYCMIHGREEGECLKVIEDIAKKSGITDYQMLVTGEEYKKTAPVYFVGKE